MASIKKLKTGLWQAQVFTQGVRASATKPTKIEAKDWAAQKEHEIKTSAGEKKTTVTFGEAAQRYELEFSRAKRGAKWEQGQINRLMEMPLAKLKLSDVSRDDVRRWRDSRLKSVQGSTVNREWNLLTHIFTMARDEWELISTNPMSGVKKPKENPPRDRLVSLEEIERLGIVSGFDGGVMTSAQGRVYLAFLFAIETAMRAGEICKLEWSMVEKEKRTASLSGEITKTGRGRDVALSTRAVQLLELLPPTTKAGCFGMTSVQLDPIFRKLKQKAAIEGLNFHDTRHEAITRLAKKMPVLALARNVGHSDINQLMTYYNEPAENLARLLD